MDKSPTNGKHRARNYHIDPDVLRLMDEVKARDGVPYTRMVNTALREWLGNRTHTEILISK